MIIRKMRDHPRTTLEYLGNDMRAGTTGSKVTISNNPVQATVPKGERSGQDLSRGMGQNPCCRVCRAGQELAHCSFCNKGFSFISLLYQILTSFNKMQPIKLYRVIFFIFLIESLTVDV